MLRIICMVRPKYVLVENVAALINRGLCTVLGDLAESGYDAEWQVLSAKAFGAPHLRERLFIVAYPNKMRRNERNPKKFQEKKKKRELCSIFFKPGCKRSRDVSNSESIYAQGFEYRQKQRKFRGSDWWAIEPDVGRMAHGVSRRVDRLKSLGNAVVPQIAEYLGRLIIDFDEA